MKHTLKITFVVAAVLMLASCYKCPPEGDHVVAYTVDKGPVQRVYLVDNNEWQALLDRFCDYAEDGSEVTFYNANHKAAKSPTKEAVTYSTTDREEMKRWMAQMEDEGMTVTVTFDPATGTYSGTAYATNTDANILSQWNFVQCHVIRYCPGDSSLNRDYMVTEYAAFGDMTFFDNGTAIIPMLGTETIYPPIYQPTVYYWTLSESQDTMTLVSESLYTMQWHILEHTDSSLVFRHRDSVETHAGMYYGDDTYIYRRH